MLFSVKHELRKFFFMTCSLEILHDLRRTWITDQYSWFQHSLLRDFQMQALWMVRVIYQLEDWPRYTCMQFACNNYYTALTLPFAILLSSYTVSKCKNRPLKRVFYLVVFVIWENKILISVIHYSFPFLNHVSTPPPNPCMTLNLQFFKTTWNLKVGWANAKSQTDDQRTNLYA